MSVQSLSYLGLNVADVAAWRRFATEVLGMQDAGAGPGGQTTLRLDDQAARIMLHASPADDLGYLGFDMADAGTALALAMSLQAGGIQVRPMRSDEADARGCGGGYVFSDPDGLQLELAYGMQRAENGFKSPRAVTFVTGDQGLGHVVVATSDLERGIDFYGAIGFRVSDFIETELAPGMRVKLAFLHCNARHHTLALLPLPTPKRLNHLMVQVETSDMVLAAYYRAQKANHQIVRHMGRHTNDMMLSFYTDTPAGFHVEYGCDAVTVGEDWTVGHHDAISIWGHEGS